MIYKYGGFYLDLDYVVFNDLRKVVKPTLHCSSDFLTFLVTHSSFVIIFLVLTTLNSQYSNVVVGNKP